MAPRKKSAAAEGAASGADVGKTRAQRAVSRRAQQLSNLAERPTGADRKAGFKPAPSEAHLHEAEAGKKGYIFGTVSLPDGRSYAAGDEEQLREELSAEEIQGLVDRGALRGKW